jgi:hypothetical protein
VDEAQEEALIGQWLANHGMEHTERESNSFAFRVFSVFRGSPLDAQNFSSWRKQACCYDALAEQLSITQS